MTAPHAQRAARAEVSRSSLPRLQALEDTGLLEPDSERSEFATLTALICRLLSVPVALISLIDEDSQVILAQSGLSDPWNTLDQLPLSHSLCQYTLGNTDPLVIEDARVHPLATDNPAISELGVVAYAGLPLTLESGEALGSLCAVDTQTRSWSSADLELLSRLAQLAADQLSLRRALRTESRRVREREALLSMAAHELKNPLSVLIGMSDLLEAFPSEAPLGPEGRELVQQVGQTAGRIDDLLGRILDATLLERGGLALHKRPMDLAALTRRVVAEMRFGQRRHEVSLELGHEVGESLMLEGDPERLEQVLRNLLANAVKYSPHGGRIAVRLSRTAQRVALEVEDHGLGIPPHALETLFERFSRVQGGEAEGLGGLGLGLYVTAQIVQGHAGRIEVESTPGKGSLFRVLLSGASGPLERH